MMDTQSALRRYREREGKTLDEIATAFGVHKTSVLRWEEGRVPAERAATLSSLTGIPLHELRPDIFPAPETERTQ